MSHALIPLAQGPRVSNLYCLEAIKGVVPASPVWKQLRLVSKDIDLEKTILQSKEVHPDRQIYDVRHGMWKTGGKFGGEFQLINQDDMIQSAMSGSWYSVTSASLSFTAGSHQYTRGSGSFLTDGFRPGDLIQGVGFTNAANNAVLRVTAVVSGALTVDDTLVPLITETSTAVITLVGQRIDIGVIQTTFSVEQQMQDIQMFQVFNGCIVDQWDLKGQADTITTSDFTLLGLNAGPRTGTSLLTISNEVQTETITGTLSAGTINLNWGGLTTSVAYNATAGDRQTAMLGLTGTGNITVTGTGPFIYTFIGQLAGQSQPLITTTGSVLTGGSSAIVRTTPGGVETALNVFSTNSPTTSFDGTLYEGGVLYGIITGFDFSLKNNRSLGGVVGSHTSPDIFEGSNMTTGNVAAYIANATLFNKFRNETESSLWIRMSDPNGTDFLNIIWNRIKYTGAKKTIPDAGGVTEAMPFTALRDRVSGVQMSVQRSNLVGP